AVEALEPLGALRGAQGVVGADPPPLVAQHQRYGLEPGAGREGGPAAPHRRLDVANGPREHREDVVVAVVAATTLRRDEMASPRLGLAPSSHALLLLRHMTRRSPQLCRTTPPEVVRWTCGEPTELRETARTSGARHDLR